MQEGNREDALRVHDEINEALQSFNRAAIESANVAVRSLLLINGGASVALLAFIGAIETGNPEVDSRVLVEPIWWFAVGVGLAVFVAVLAYVVNYLDAAIMSEMRRIWHPPYVQEAPFMWKNIFRNAAILRGAASEHVLLDPVLLGCLVDHRRNFKPGHLAVDAGEG